MSFFMGARIATNCFCSLSGTLNLLRLFARSCTSVGEKPVDALVGGDVLHEVIDHRRNGGIAAKPIIERSRLGKRAAPSERECE
jgi:hypothetical protein